MCTTLKHIQVEISSGERGQKGQAYFTITGLVGSLEPNDFLLATSGIIALIICGKYTNTHSKGKSLTEHAVIQYLWWLLRLWFIAEP